MNRQLQRLILLVSLFLTSVGFVSAQRTITGKITDESGEPMIGVNILVVGTSQGTVSDFDGTYTITVPAEATQLQYTYTGYDRVIVDLGPSGSVDVVMGEGAILEDVVVTGYGTVKRENVTGAINTVKSKDFNKGAITAPQELLAGKVAGVSVVTSGEPGGGSVIRVRGGSSLLASNDPLIIIDGVPVSNNQISGSRNALNVVNPNDIETFTVLKDASATAIYGSRASNGVIIITTKKGSLERKLALEYNAYAAVSQIAKKSDPLSPDEFRGYIDSRYDDTHPASSLLGEENTDWQDEIYQDGFAMDHNLSLNGHFGDMPYRVSLGLTTKEGILKTDEFNRFTWGVNLNPGLFNNTLQFNLTAKGMRDENHFANQGAIGSSVVYDPTQPIHQENQFGNYFAYTNADGSPNTLAPANPVALLEQTNDNSTVDRYILGATIDYRFFFLENLRANLNLGYDHSEGIGRRFVPADAAFDYTNGGSDRHYSQENKNELLEFFLDYNADLSSDFNFDIMGGYSWQHFYFNNTGVTTSSEIDPGEMTFDTLSEYDVNPREFYLVSLFGRLNVTLFENFLFTFTLRRDGTSRFSEDTRWGNFPGAAVAWKMIDRDDNVLSDLKLRLSYGQTGQQGVGDDYYPYLAKYEQSTSTATYQFGNEYVSTLRPAGYDANLKWETTTTYNLGLDYGLWRDRLRGSVDFYIRETEDLINRIPVPAGTNLTDLLVTNVGDLENKGVELAIDAVPWRSGVKEWSFGFNVAVNDNEITNLTATDDPNYQGVLTGPIAGGVGNTIQIHSVGYPTNSFLVYEQVYDAAGRPIEGLYVDRNGDGIVTPADQYRYKKAAADAVFGFYSTLDLGHFDFSFGARAMAGNYIYDNNLVNRGVVGFTYGSSGEGYLNNVDAQAPSLDFETSQAFSDYYIKDGSFLRFDHITAGWDFGQLGSIHGLRLYATVQNPILITSYDGIDPEIAQRQLDNTVRTGIDDSIYPRSRTFLFGLNVKF